MHADVHTGRSTDALLLNFSFTSLLLGVIDPGTVKHLGFHTNLSALGDQNLYEKPRTLTVVEEASIPLCLL